MTTLASKGQLRASIMRWALLTVPACVLIGFIGTKLGSTDSVWFRQLQLPDGFPSMALFPMIWMLLFAVSGFALALVCASWGARRRGLAIALFAISFVLNMIWFQIFLGSFQLTGGLVVIGLAMLVLVPTIVLFWQIRSLAGALLIPYLAWMGYMGFLNWQLLELNPDLDGVDPTDAVQRIDL